MRKTYGNTWWGKQWLNALTNIDYSNRLPRGRSYANTQKVESVVIQKNVIKAKVKGSRPIPYRVEVIFPPLNDIDKNKIIDQIVDNPIYLSHLLNRQLPSGLFDFCEKNRIKIFPKTWTDLDFECTCPDWAVPCKHEAATVYMVANEIDKDPFLVFKLQGLDILEELRHRGIVEEKKDHTAILRSTDFWAETVDYPEPPLVQTIFEAIDYATIPPSKGIIFSLLSPSPPFYNKGDFKKVMEKIYDNAQRNLLQHLKRRDANSEKQETPAFFNRVDEINIFISDEFAFQKIVLFSNGKNIYQTDRFEYFLEWLDYLPAGQIAGCTQPMVALYAAYQFAFHLLQKDAYVPQIVRSQKETYGLRWIPALVSEEVRVVHDLVQRLMPVDFIAFDTVKNGKKTIQTCKPSEITNTLVHLFLKHFITNTSTLQGLYLEDLAELFFVYPDFLEFDDFENKETPKVIHLWLNRFFLTEKDYLPLVKVEEDDGYFKIELFVEHRRDPLQEPIPLNVLLHDAAYTSIRVGVLQDIAMMAEFFPQMEQLIQAADYALLMGGKEFSQIFLEVLPVIRLFGIRVLLPKSLHKLLRPRISMEIVSKEDPRVALSSVISMEGLLRFDWRIAIGEELMDAETFAKTVEGLSGIVKIKDQFVYVDDKEMSNLLEKIKNPPEISTQEVFQSALAEEYDGATVRLDEKAREILHQLVEIQTVPTPDNLQATLRPYQKKGYEWLYKNAQIGMGSLIADDMGLGKTLQVITALLKFKQEGALQEKKALVVVPTTLLTNWSREIRKFAPDLRAQIYHGTGRNLETEAHDLILTTYGIARSETARLAKIHWSIIILDEAQNIKNPQTAQTKAIKKLKGDFKIAMTGTPVENRLSEYWSIFDFINKGYLYGLTKFKDNFARPIEVDKDKNALERFRRITAPFILRRVKSDKSIIQDLPDKVEIDQICHLSTQQAALYQSVVDNMLEQIEKTSAIERRGLILKLMTALKQICNHPSHYLKKKDIQPSESGKTELLLELLRQILDNNEKVLIFTQYRQMGDLLVQLIEPIFGLEVPFLHGGLVRKDRDLMVEDFQQKPYVKVMIISLKAGGTGLNLTAASNVIHYDLWWNPAVEAQATDRAYRIGQHRNVQVHRFITQKTFEEKINQLIQSKKELADMAVSVGETWLGDLSNEDLKSLVRLG